MYNSHYPFLFKGISEEDFAFLKAREDSILNGVRTNLKYSEGANEKEMQYFEMNKPSFKYNPTRQFLGIYLKEGRTYRLILSKEDLDVMSDVERKIFFAMRGKLEETLEGIKIRKERWK